MLIGLVGKVIGEEEPEPTLNSTKDNQELDGNGDEIYSSTPEKAPDAIGMPQPIESKPRHHQKHKNPGEDVQPHTRRPLYEVVNQPCYSAGCGGYGPQDGFTGSRWQPGRNRYAPGPGPGPYPRYYEPRRRGGYREQYPAPGYGGPNYSPNYAPQYPDYGYGSRKMPFYPQDRFTGYGRPPYDDYFLG